MKPQWLIRKVEERRGSTCLQSTYYVSSTYYVTSFIHRAEATKPGQRELALVSPGLSAISATPKEYCFGSKMRFFWAGRGSEERGERLVPASDPRSPSLSPGERGWMGCPFYYCLSRPHFPPGSGHWMASTGCPGLGLQ